ncbi:response regulator [Lacticaseibacillus kribbianus]|uniref:response regulator n=1 Tax=Lacticaseibacillus kribbianus TaxID=2926292 RepID=UPI001CD811F0|nr:response regulator [Lacticaseibacillus kribbianus]
MIVLLVDDDRFVINVLKQTIDWPALGFTTVLAAANMRQAQAQLQANSVDLVISDIEMPQGSGLDLLDWIRHTLHRDTETIFLTNYADFNYAQKAIELGSFDYYLKPIIPDRFTAVVHKAAAKIRARQVQATTPAAGPTPAAWRAVLLGPPSPAVAGEFTGLTLLPIVLQPEASTDLAALRKALIRADLALPGWRLGTQAVDENHRLVNVLQTSTPTAAAAPLAVASRLRAVLAPVAAPFTTFIGTATTAETLSAVCQRLTLMVDDLAVHRDTDHLLAGYRHQETAYLEPDLQRLAALIARKDADALEATTDAYLQTCLREGKLSRRTLRNFREDLLQQIYVSLERHNVQAHKLFSSKAYAALYQDSLNSLEALAEFIRYVTQSAFSYAAFADSQVSVGKQLQQYINTHLGDDLTREKLAEVVFLNPDYAAKLFKDAYGMSLTPTSSTGASPRPKP